MCPKKTDLPIIRPRQKRDFAKPRAVFLPFDPAPELPFKRELLGRGKRGRVRTRILPFGKVYVLPASLVAYNVIGTALNTSLLEEMIASGVREVLVLGIAGSLAPRFAIGRAVLVKKAVSDEGVSPHYYARRRTFEPSPGLTRRTAVELERLRIPYSQGTVISTDAFYRETHAWLHRSRKRGAHLVDMETSAVFSVAEFHGIEAAAVLVVSDELHSGTWNPGFSLRSFQGAVKRSFLPFIRRLE